MAHRFIEVDGARQNNLKGASVRVPIGAVTAVTGVAGAGKSSLAFDVLYAEGLHCRGCGQPVRRDTAAVIAGLRKTD